MESPNDAGGNYWGTLINPDKSPAPLLNDLCIGLAQLMVKLDSGNGSTDLTPDKLARFYREVGGNYDSLFRETKGSALSFIYQSLGCFHILQPTTNPFEPPSIPALLPTGFIRWQVMNLLLCPDEHVQYLQAALNRWDVPNPNGGTFPKVIPREAFPATPDKDMVEWHETVSQRLEKELVDQKSADQRSTRRYSPADFVRYYSAATGAQKHRYPEDYFSPRDDHHFHDGHSTPKARNFSDHADEIRHHRRHRSPDSGAYRARMFANGSDVRSDSRTSSRNPSPKQPVERSKTMRVRNRDMTPDQKPFHRKHRPMASSDSSNNDDGLFPRRRHGSTDDRRHGRSAYLSPARSPGQRRRHSHDATSPIEPESPRHHKQDYSPAKTHYPVPRTLFRENMFDELPRPGRGAADQPLSYEIKPKVLRVHVNVSPSKLHASKRESGSSGSDRTSSSSHGSGEAGWKRRNSPSRGGGRRVSQE